MGIKAYKLIKLMENGPSDENEKNFVNYFEDARLTVWKKQMKENFRSIFLKLRLPLRILWMSPG